MRRSCQSSYAVPLFVHHCTFALCVYLAAKLHVLCVAHDIYVAGLSVPDSPLAALLKSHKTETARLSVNALFPILTFHN